MNEHNTSAEQQSPTYQEGVYPVIMAGGSGTRFWPMSRQHLPKQFLNMGGDQSLIEATMKRLDALAPRHCRYVVAGEQHSALVKQHCPDLDDLHLIIEPCARNTAPCVALAAQHIYQRDPQGIMILLPADHHITDVTAFTKALESAVEGAQEGKILTLGVVPTRAETGYGYIQYEGGGIRNQSRLPVTQFVEKPPKSIAEQYLASGEYLWNSGVFIFSVETILREFQSQLPNLAKEMSLVGKALMGEDQTHYQQVLDRAFLNIKPVSVDVGIMEGAECIEVIPLEAGWSDVGHWGALHEVHPVDSQQNILLGHPEHLVLDACQVTIQSNKFTAVVGLDGLVVVNTDDATLVCAQDRVQDVRTIVEYLNQCGLKTLT